MRPGTSIQTYRNVRLRELDGPCRKDARSPALRDEMVNAIAARVRDECGIKDGPARTSSHPGAKAGGNAMRKKGADTAAAVLRLLAEGRSTCEVAYAVNRSYATVRTIRRRAERDGLLPREVVRFSPAQVRGEVLRLALAGMDKMGICAEVRRGPKTVGCLLRKLRAEGLIP